MESEHPTTLVDVFVRSAQQYPDKPALVVEGTESSYSELLQSARKVAAVLPACPPGQPALIGVFAAASATAFEGILGVLLTGSGYVPLNPSFPAARSAFMLNASGVSTLIVDHNASGKLAEVLQHVDRTLTLILPDAVAEELGEWRANHPQHRFVGSDELHTSSASFPDADPTDIAYLMFTSGSTGKPKGVMISHLNILSYLDAMCAWYDFQTEDRFSQMFDLTFDLSLFDTFVCWAAGAALYVVPVKDRMAPAGFVRRNALTVWFSVPAVAGFMNQLKMLKPNNFPSLRVSAFCGEPLPASLAASWQAAAPNSVVDNLYGPTELTVACTGYRWDSQTSPEESENGLVPIGKPYPMLNACLVDSKLERVPEGKLGELCVRGPQTALGYWQRTDLTEERFVAMPWTDGDDNRWYRTGDLVRQNGNGDFVFSGRVDNQVKILGYRVELGEIEAQLRTYAQTDFAVAVPWPVTGGNASGVVACISGSAISDEEILRGCKRDLPDYMVPKRIFRLEKMPLNSNGKTDRNQIKQHVEELTSAVNN